MPYDLQILDLAPVTMDRVNVRMTNSTIVDLYCDVFRTKSATLELHEFKRTSLRISRHPLCGIRAVSASRRFLVSHTVMDYTAILKLIETRFKLPNLTARDAAQPNMTEFFDFANVPWATPPTPTNQVKNMACVLEALNAVTISPNPAPAGGQATVTLSLAKSAIQDTNISLSSNPSGVVPPSVVIASGTSSTTLTITAPTGITSLTITGSIGGIPVSGTVPVQ